jgi:16S rRNA (guanine527-N7)-methyltransferase
MTSPANMSVTALAVPDAPPAAAAVFGDRLPLAVTYANLLAGPGVERGLLGPREATRLWERHLLNCAGLTELLEPGQQVLDAGSGAGLPGIVLGLRRDDIEVVLVEPLQRRARFLAEVVEALGLPHVSVRRARLEDLAGKTLVDVVVARAVAPLDRLAMWTLPLLRAGGRLLALKGDQADAELAAGRPALRRAGADGAEVVTVGSEDEMTQARVVVVVRGAGAVDRRRTERS